MNQLPSRRDFLKLTGLAAAGVASAPLLASLDQTAALGATRLSASSASKQLVIGISGDPSDTRSWEWQLRTGQRDHQEYLCSMDQVPVP